MAVILYKVSFMSAGPAMFAKSVLSKTTSYEITHSLTNVHASELAVLPLTNL